MCFMTTLSHPYERIDLRTSPEIKALIVRAAATAGVSLSAFLIASAQERAKQILAENETLTLSPRDWDAFFAALDSTDKPRPKLEAAATEYLARRNSQDAR
jgi:uncharacterized protein (DUF1778 family)